MASAAPNLLLPSDVEEFAATNLSTPSDADEFAATNSSLSGVVEEFGATNLSLSGVGEEFGAPNLCLSDDVKEFGAANFGLQSAEREFVPANPRFLAAGNEFAATNSCLSDWGRIFAATNFGLKDAGREFAEANPVPQTAGGVVLARECAFCAKAGNFSGKAPSCTALCECLAAFGLGAWYLKAGLPCFCPPEEFPGNMLAAFCTRKENPRGRFLPCPVLSARGLEVFTKNSAGCALWPGASLYAGGGG